jgi:hypothetical protein
VIRQGGRGALGVVGMPLVLTLLVEGHWRVLVAEDYTRERRGGRSWSKRLGGRHAST